MSIPRGHPQARARARLPDRFTCSSYLTRHHGTGPRLSPAPRRPGAPLASARGTHALVEHVRLVPQLRVLAQMLPDHLHPLHLQPFQLLQRRKPAETSGGVPSTWGPSPPCGSHTPYTQNTDAAR